MTCSWLKDRLWTVKNEIYVPKVWPMHKLRMFCCETYANVWNVKNMFSCRSTTLQTGLTTQHQTIRTLWTLFGFSSQALYISSTYTDDVPLRNDSAEAGEAYHRACCCWPLNGERVAVGVFSGAPFTKVRYAADEIGRTNVFSLYIFNI